MTTTDERRLVALAGLVGRLRAAATFDDVRGAVVELAAPATGTARADLCPPGEPPVGSGLAVLLHDLKGDVVAVLTLEPDGRELDEGDRAATEVVAELCGTAVRRIHLFQRATALATLGAGLAGAVTTRDVAEVLSEHGRGPLGAAMVNCRVVDATGRALESLLERTPIPEALRERYASVPLDSTAPLSDAARTDTPVWIADPDDLAARYPGIVEDARLAGFQALAAIPLHDSEGHVTGALALAWSTPIRFDPLIRATILTVGELASQAYERARETDRRAREARALNVLAGDLAAAASRAAVAAAVATHLPEIAGAAWATLGHERAPGTAPEGVAVDGTTLRIGVLDLGWADEPHPDVDLLARLRTVSDLVAQALERAERHDSEHELVAALQHRFLAATVEPAGARLACRYLPASRAVGIGGDWYDVVDRGGGRFALVVGDVTGHGVDAVTAMAQLRTLLNGLLRASEPVATVFERVEAMVDRADRLFASAAVFDVDAHAGMLDYVSAGHPWALLRRPGGVVELLDGAQRALLGASLSPVDPATVAFGPGDLLVAYTDGLVERRDEPITAGIERLVAALRSLPDDVDVDAAADALLRAGGLVPAGGGALDDDVALVVLQAERPGFADA